MPDIELTLTTKVDAALSRTLEEAETQALLNLLIGGMIQPELVRWIENCPWTSTLFDAVDTARSK